MNLFQLVISCSTSRTSENIARIRIKTPCMYINMCPLQKEIYVLVNLFCKKMKINELLPANENEDDEMIQAQSGFKKDKKVT